MTICHLGEELVFKLRQNNPFVSTNRGLSSLRKFRFSFALPCADRGIDKNCYDWTTILSRWFQLLFGKYYKTKTVDIKALHFLSRAKIVRHLVYHESFCVLKSVADFPDLAPIVNFFILKWELDNLKPTIVPLSHMNVYVATTESITTIQN